MVQVVNCGRQAPGTGQGQGARVLPRAEHVSSYRMCEGEKRKLVIPSELGKRVLLTGDRVRGVYRDKGDGCFSFCIDLHSVPASSKSSCVQQWGQGKALGTAASGAHFLPLQDLLQPLLISITPSPFLALGCDGQRLAFSLAVCRTLSYNSLCFFMHL